ncbi:putative dual-specificity RNA methyltransferase RlmN 1 [Desulfosarcina cetonica]|uniref:23S rRNA (adenine(2503)-C(2))-methyltransferase RlmN n=1 Tax=Desulfosarcina cetonica TaxID=90730 RepID=UPI0006D171DF|nr:23S rRNA (adenine(2503)-C(2))-methyltransferase RlmN [Desulfosarcina cetonica]VTR69200.1 putative dual-specificity RNA methyltransferase RlmN 1 [Desulfosarcina cetonica]
MNILDQTHDQFAESFFQRYGKRTFYSTPVYHQVMHCGSVDLDRLSCFSRLPALAGQLRRDLVLDTGRVVAQAKDHGVVKFITRLADGLDIESVIIPMFRRFTLCVSSQVGCRMGCRFCRTGRMGLLRSLTTAEIVGQVHTARHRLGVDVRNVVFMGMGEPLDNLDNVMQAIRVLSDQRGMDIARRYITVSTVGLIGGIDRLAGMDGTPVNLAISLNAPDDTLRSRLMPVNRAMPMAPLREALLRYPLARKSAIFVEYVLIDGVNDRPEHALAVARYLAPLPVKLNLIAYNPAPGDAWKAPSTESYTRFRDRLVAEKIFVRRRGEKGGRIMAACGQLGGAAAGSPEQL